MTSSGGNDQFSTGNFGGRPDNFRFEISQRNLKKGTFTLVLRQGDDSTKSKKVIETFENISLDPGASNYILKELVILQTPYPLKMVKHLFNQLVSFQTNQRTLELKPYM